MNALSTLLQQTKAAGKSVVPESAAIREKMDNINAVKNAEMRPAAPPRKSSPPSPVDKINPGGQYGNRPGEKRIPEAASWAKPLGSYKEGGAVTKTGNYQLHKGEQVLTPEHQHHLKKALSLAEATLSHEKEKEPAEPKKEVKEMRIRKGASGGHVIIHVHNAPHLHPEEEHVTSGTDQLMDHVMQHMSEPDEGEEEAEAGDNGMEPEGGQ